MKFLNKINLLFCISILIVVINSVIVEKPKAFSEFYKFSFVTEDVINAYKEFFSKLMNEARILKKDHSQIAPENVNSEFILALHLAKNRYELLAKNVSDTCTLNQLNYDAYQNLQNTPSEPTDFKKKASWHLKFLNASLQRTTAEVSFAKVETIEIGTSVLRALNKFASRVKKNLEQSVQAELAELMEKVQNEEKKIEKADWKWYTIWKRWLNRKDLEGAQKAKGELEEIKESRKRFLNFLNEYMKFLDKIKEKFETLIEKLTKYDKKLYTIGVTASAYEDVYKNNKLEADDKDGLISELQKLTKDVYEISCTVFKLNFNEV